MERLARSIGVAVCLLRLVPIYALPTDSEAEAFSARMQELVERISAQERELGEMKAQQAALMEHLERMRRASAPAPEHPQPESAAQAVSTAGGKSYFADHLRVGGYGSLRFEANDIG